MAGTLFLALSATALAQTWNGGGTGDAWSLGANWGGTAPASGNTTTVSFGGSTRLSPDLDSNMTVKALQFNSGAGAFDLISTAGDTLTFDPNSTGTSSLVVNNSTSLQTIDFNLSLLNSNAGATTMGSILASSGDLTINGNIAVGGTSTTSKLILTSGTGHTLTANGVISGGSNAVSFSLGGGTIVVGGSAANTFTGGNSGISGAGTLVLDKTAGTNAISSSQFYLSPGSGTVKLGNSEQIANTTKLIFQGGTFNLNAFSETIGTLSIAANSGAIDLGNGSAGGLTASGTAWTAGTLTIYDWVNGHDYIRFTSAPTSSFLSNVAFDGYGVGASYYQSGGYYYLTATPEPGVATLLLLGTAATTAARLGLSRRNPLRKAA